MRRLDPVASRPVPAFDDIVVPRQVDEEILAPDLLFENRDFPMLAAQRRFAREVSIQQCDLARSEQEAVAKWLIVELKLVEAAERGDMVGSNATGSTRFQAG